MACLRFSEPELFLTCCLSLLLLCPLAGLAKKETHVGSEKRFVNHSNTSNIFTTQSTIDFQANKHYPIPYSLYKYPKTEVGFVQLTFPEEFLDLDPPYSKSGSSSRFGAKSRHKRDSPPRPDFSTMNCTDGPDSLVNITLLASSPASSPFKNYKMCNRKEITEEKMSHGQLEFEASCCLRNCILNFEISAPEGSEILLTFDRLDIPATTLINTDQSHKCEETSGLFFIEDGYEFCGFQKPPAFRLTRNIAHFVFVIRGTEKCHSGRSFLLKGSSCPPIDTEQVVCPHYHVPPKKGKSGFLMSPFFDKMEHYPKNVRCSWNITVENNSFVQLHFEFFQLPPASGNYLSLYSANIFDELAPVDLTITDEDLRNIPDHTIVLPSRTVTVTFVTDDAKATKGFKINYKAVGRDKYIPLVNATSLNCTDFNTFPEHIACNYRPDCEGGEDEMDCPYDDQTLCPGGQRYGDSCYYVIESHENILWDDAEDICQKNLSGHLVTPNTLAEIAMLKKLIAVNHSISEAMFYMGLREFTVNRQGLYRNLKKGLDGTTYFSLIDEFHSTDVSSCLVWRPSEANSGVHLLNIPCSAPWKVRETEQRVHAICEIRADKHKPNPLPPPLNESSWDGKIETHPCKTGEKIIISRRCDGAADCWDGSDEMPNLCKELEGQRAMFTCKSGSKVAFAHVCDGYDDCLDNSDEVFCHPLIRNSTVFRSCSNGQPVLRDKWCNAVTDCLDGSDENDCKDCREKADFCPTFGCYPGKWKGDPSLDCMLLSNEGRWMIETKFEPHVIIATPPPAKIEPDGYGKVEIHPLTDQELCPETHVQCPNGYCIPIFMLCNDQEDCPEGQDENEQTCREFCKNKYKCHKSTICLHQDQVCDGAYHCPLLDDELFCKVYSNCPPNCTCSNLEMNCQHIDFDLTQSDTRVKFLTISNPVEKTEFSLKSYVLVGVSAVGKGIEELGTLDLQNLYSLDLSQNNLRQISQDSFSLTKEIRILNLAYNKLENFDFLRSLEKLEIVDLSGNDLPILKLDFFQHNTKLQEIRMERMKLHTIETGAFDGLTRLKKLELTGNPATNFEEEVFRNLTRLSFLSTDNFKLCCSSFTPESLKKGTCKSPANEISSCEDILRNMVLRTFLWVMAALTVLGNTAVLLYRAWEMRIQKSTKGLGYGVFITSLSGSDLLMGIYLTIIGGADIYYRGIYQLSALKWQKSALCSFAGFLCMVSSEVSAMTICLVTIDRFLVLAFPFSRIRFTPYSAKIASIITWFIGFVLSGIPLLPPLDYWEFFQQNGVCIPLPITRVVFDGSDYSFGIFIVFNFVIFVIIAIGQALIFWAIKTNSMKAVNEKQKKQHIAVTRKLALVVITDFLCWFPIGIMGIMSRSGIPIPGEANVVSTIFILPLNSALNPFLYTISAIRQNRRDKLSTLKGSSEQQNVTNPTASTVVSTISTNEPDPASAPENVMESLTNVRMKQVELWLKLGKLTFKDIETCIRMFEVDLKSQPSLSISASDDPTK